MRFANEWTLKTEWQIFLKELISQGADLHAISSGFHTPFLELLTSRLYLPSIEFNSAFMKFSVSTLDDRESMEHPVSGSDHSTLLQDRKLSWILYTWLESLQECGVDLHEYGRKETDLHKQGLVSWEVISDFLSSDRLLLTSFTYGPSPSDWTLDLEYPRKDTTESLAKVPGGWVEDDSSE